MIPPYRPRGAARYHRVAPLVLFFLFACSSPPRQAQTPPPGSAGAPAGAPPTTTPAPAVDSPTPVPAYRLQFGEGGGFTGAWGGYTVERNGVVLQWRGRDPDDAPSDTLGILSGEGRRIIWEELQRAGFFEATADERGNMTRFIRVEADDLTHALTWSYVPTIDTLATGKSWIVCEAAVMAAEPLPGR